MTWAAIAQLRLVHDYYAPNMPPVTVRPADPTAFDKEGLLLRQMGPRVLVVAEEDNTELPESVTLDLDVQNPDVIALTEGASWTHVPQIGLPLHLDNAQLSAAGPSDVPQPPSSRKLAQVSIGLSAGSLRRMTLRCEAVASHWAYHVTGPGSEEVVIEDTEGAVLFDALGAVDLPDGTPAHVIRSRDALPARARPLQRFSLSRPGPFGPRTLIPVLPAPQPLFTTVPTPDGAGALIQSDIYVSIF
ncbi:hypothetical protein [uncultured Roseobacter sp.]|uniref:hypothetical protein n=1 Tax=uncultured Roseobacter sp. TaxID=114847 RepID=UPI00261C12F6|nr:hypothetical protein [uncultured Roseobacter sp.]